MTQNNQKAKHQKTQKKHSQETRSELTFLEHFYELRKRLFWVVLTLVATSALGFQYKDELISIVMAPLHGEKLIYLTPAGGFSFIFTLSIYFGALLSIPVIIYNIYRFLQPLLARSSRRLLLSIVVLSTLLAAGGAAFGYFVTIPGAINFLMNFAGDAVVPNLTAESYLNFVVAYVLGLAALFQLPLLLFLFDHIRPIPPGMLSSTQRFVIIGATILAAVITPTPDALNMMIVAIPIILIYELGALVVFIRRHIGRKVKAVKRQPVIETVEMPVVALAKQPEPLTDIIEDLAPIPAQPLGTMQAKRTVDGMLVTRQPAPISRSSARTVDSTRLVPQRAAVEAKPLRTIDGFFPSVASQNT